MTTKTNKVLELFEGPAKMGIQLDQSTAKHGQFTVTYGKHIEKGLGYSRACHELGACILHYLACEGIVNNQGQQY